MAQTKNERVKQGLLLAFVIVSVVLVGLIWADGLVEDVPATPSYYRGAADDGQGRAVTAVVPAGDTPTPAAAATPHRPGERPQEDAQDGDEPLILPSLDDDDA